MRLNCKIWAKTSSLITRLFQNVSFLQFLVVCEIWVATVEYWREYRILLIVHRIFLFILNTFIIFSFKIILKLLEASETVTSVNEKKIKCSSKFWTLTYCMFFNEITIFVLENKPVSTALKNVIEISNMLHIKMLLWQMRTLIYEHFSPPNWKFSRFSFFF